MRLPASQQLCHGPERRKHVMNEIPQFLLSYGGPALFAIVFVEQAGLPVPAAPWLLAAGALAASGKLNPVLAIGLATLACVIADGMWFYVGRRGGQRVLRLFCRLSLARTNCVGRTKTLFARRGLQALVAAKFLPGLGAVMPPLAGALGVSTSRFLFLDTLGSLFYGGFYVIAGYLFHNQLLQLMGMLSQLGLSALWLALVLVPGFIAFKFIRRRPPQAGSPNPVTSEGRAFPEPQLVLAGSSNPQPAPHQLVQPCPCEL
jgi:membrane protein DedA with SNARE-associated domain